MKKAELIAKALELNLTFDAAISTVDSLKTIIAAAEAQRIEEEAPVTKTLSDIILDNLLAVKTDLEEKTAQLEKDMANGHDTESLASDIKALRNKAHELSILLNLYRLGRESDTTKFFREITEKTTIGQYFNIGDFNALFGKIAIPDGMDFASDRENMIFTLGTINSVINLINDSQLFETIAKDILPRITNDDSNIDFAVCKKAIQTFVENNNATFATDFNLHINNDDAKTFILSLIKITKRHDKNTVNIVRFAPFLSLFQGMISTKVNNIVTMIDKLKKA